MNRLLLASATGLGIGRLRLPAPVAGSLVALPLSLPLMDLPFGSALTAIAVFSILGFFCAGGAEKILDRPDAPEIIIDEVTGALTVLVFAPPHPAGWCAGLLLFCLFAAVKPWPASWVGRHLHGGIAIMLDDLIVALYAFACLQLLWHLLPA